MSWLDEIDIDDLGEPHRSIAKEIGLDNLKKIAKLLEGDYVYFPKLEKVCDPKRKELIRKEFNGYNYKELASKYGYTERWVRVVVLDMVTKERNKPIENQVSIFEFNKNVV